MQQRRFHHRTEIVGIGNKGIPDSRVEQSLQPAAADQCGIEIAMTGRAPFQLGVLRPAHRSECGGIELGHLVLHQLDLTAVVHAFVLIALQMRQRVLAGVEAVHQQQSHIFPTGLSQVEDLSHHDVEEIRPVAHREKTFRRLQTHAGAQSAVELDHHHLA